jgi:hypothetical protein
MACLGAVALALSACGGEAVIDLAAAGGGGSTTTTTTSSTSGTTTTSTTTGSVALEITLVAASAWADCMPAVPPDPLHLEFTRRLRNLGPQAASADLVGTRVVSSLGATEFLVSPKSTGPIPAQTTVDSTFFKEAGSGTGTNGCQYCGAGDLWLEIDAEVDGVPVPVAGPVDAMGCAF